ncbi:MAG: D-alanyl-D-alanine carboxypeptidase/D-alanyl-D-alanine-endopeptidase [Deltaproteobacteria bacterium]|nr:MAG: D-alanyl-D-alanine carboxypeptidase/D-alanyl-D-alanine-endopeptidase [Deltaproteobacteria bacterium]
MPVHLAITALLAAAAVAAPDARSKGPPGQPAPAATTDPDAARAELRRAIEAALAADFLADAQVGILVRDLEDGTTLFARQSDTLLNPASNVKLFTTFAALSLAGSAYRYPTDVFATSAPSSKGRVEGPLYLRGTGDPALVTADLYELAGRLYARGIRRVEGPVVVDATAFAADRLPPGYDQKDEFAGYRPKVGAFSVNFNTFVVRIAPGPDVGRRATVRIDPPVPSIVLDEANVDTVAGWKRKVSVVHEVDDADRIHLRVTGDIGVDASVLDYRFPVVDPSRYAGEVFLLVLRQRGIRVAERHVERGAVPRKAVRLGSHRSPAMAELVRAVNKFSNNFMAEQILYGLDDARPATFDGALARVRAYYEALGLAANALDLGNGSGLYDTNRATPRAIVRLLEHAYADFRYAPDFLASLPIVGIDGTTRRRLRKTEATGWVRAKTGTLDGVSALSGYAGATGRAPLVFAIVMNDLSKWKGHAARKVQDRIAEALARYAKATAPSPRPNAPSPAEPRPAQ